MGETSSLPHYIYHPDLLTAFTTTPTCHTSPCSTSSSTSSRWTRQARCHPFASISSVTTISLKSLFSPLPEDHYMEHNLMSLILMASKPPRPSILSGIDFVHIMLFARSRRTRKRLKSLAPVSWRHPPPRRPRSTTSSWRRSSRASANPSDKLPGRGCPAARRR